MILNGVNTSEPNDMAYVSSGYAPITARLIQASMTGFSGKQEALRELLGRGMDILQRFPQGDLVTSTKRGPLEHSMGTSVKRLGKNKPLLLVYYIGGVTVYGDCRSAFSQYKS